MPWTTIVADSAGNPVENALVTVALRSTRYRKGYWDIINSLWVAEPGGSSGTGPRLFCDSEDTNTNGRLDPTEDVNNNGELDPGAVATARVIEASARTDSDGLAAIEITYPKTYALWVEVEILATITTVSGTEATAKNVFLLPAAGADLANISSSPPGSSGTIGPFGQLADCTSTD